MISLKQNPVTPNLSDPHSYRPKKLTAEQYADFYLIRKRRSDIWAVQSHFLQNTYPKNFASRASMNILSVGPGEGDMDLLFVSGLVQQGVKKIKVVFIEPNSHHITKLEARMAQTASELQRDGIQFDTQIHPHYLEQCDFGNESFDVVHFIHAIQWIPDYMHHLMQRQDRLTAGGEILIIQQSSEGVPRYHSFIKKLKGDTVGSLAAEEIAENIHNNELDFSMIKRDAFVNIDDLKSDEGKKLLSFMMSTDLTNKESESATAPLIEAMEQDSVLGPNQTRRLREPVAFIRIFAKEQEACT